MNRFFKNILHNAFVRNWEKNLKNHPIKWLELEVTRRCPITCLHCGSSCSMDSPHESELSMEEILSLCKRIASVYDPKKINVAITGGEALVRKDIFHIIAHITEMGFKASIVTNGFLIQKEHINLLYASGIRSLSVSVDGMRENHNWLRNHPQSFDRAINAIKLLTGSRMFYVEVITTVNKRSLTDIPEMEKLFTELGVHGWRFGKTFPIGRARKYPELFIDSKELKTLLEFIKSRRHNKKRQIRDYSFFEEGYYGADIELEVRDFFMQCPAGVNILTVLADGSITGCAATTEEFIQGNIRHDDVVEVWEGGFSVFRDRSWMRAGRCKGCRVWDYCRGDGFHLWERDADSPIFCNYEMLNKK